MEQNPADNPKIPPGGLKVANNPDGTFTVSSANHFVTIGTPSSAPRKGSRGGFVVAGIVAGEKLPPGTISVRDPDELAEKLGSTVSMGSIAPAAGVAEPKEVHFILKGQHTLDLGKLSGSAGGSSILAHIHMDADADPDSDDPRIPVGG
jgi:hypothetical protein